MANYKLHKVPKYWNNIEITVNTETTSMQINLHLVDKATYNK